ncbi:DUF4394 domain-containing protein [Hymenobacter crusticola]|uniref:DUF4394 domain-containing protein n=1 Tax=Hymenobacter crusticola TaxID=1770526 RepID=A0A243WEF4_9BACT|nr:DUF4394 domain-containing protein [Hymenobacter crusticola]OUJ73809.1 hypothetical protein BXP70_12595 [Hymenobacter crusticola]
MKNLFRLRKLAFFAALFFALTSCDDDGDFPGYNGSLDVPFYALEDGVRLTAFSAGNPQTPASAAAITGLQTGETILAIDFRPATGQLYGLGSTSRLYVLDPKTGAARPVGAGPFTPALAGTLAGFDFNPTVDRIRLVTSTGQNLRLNPETGTVAATDGNINGAAGASITAVAYTGNVSGSTTTTLYDIDATSQKLYKQMPPNDGTLVEVGSLNLAISGDGGFDIAPDTDKALALYNVGGKATLFSVDLATGKASIISVYNKAYTGIAIPTQPVAYAVSATNNLLIFNPEKPATAIAKPITGLASGETIVGIDFRPVNGQLYAVSSNSRVLTLNTSSGAAAVVATLSTPLVGTSFGVDFNPTVDRIRIVSNTGQNLRVNPADGVTTVDGALNPGTPAVTGAAYTNNFAGATSTTLYDLDVNTDKLYTQNPPNNGTLVEVGNLGVNVEAATGFDIGGASGTPYALLTSGGSTKLYRINLNTGAATAVGDFNASATGFALGLGF